MVTGVCGWRVGLELAVKIIPVGMVMSVLALSAEGFWTGGLPAVSGVEVTDMVGVSAVLFFEASW